MLRLIDLYIDIIIRRRKNDFGSIKVTLFPLLFNWMAYFLCLCIIVDYSKTAFEEHKEKIDMYVEPNNAMKHGINELGEKKYYHRNWRCWNWQN